MGVSQFEQQADLSPLRASRLCLNSEEHVLLALWYQHNGLPCHVIAAKKFQSGY